MTLKKGLIGLIIALLAISGLWIGQSFYSASSHSTRIHWLSKVEDQVPKALHLPGQEIELLSPLHLQAKSVILMNAKNGHIIYEKNSDQALPTASMSKMMTEFLLLKAIHEHKITWDQKVKISHYAHAISNHPGFASVHLKKDQPYTISELYKAMVIQSANGAAIALAEAVAGSEKQFVEEMNGEAKALGLRESHFVDSTGLDNTDLGSYASTGSPNDTNKMSARDLAKLAQKLITNYPEILQITSQPKLVFDHRTYVNTDWMLPAINEQHLGYAGVDGLKTGYTSEAGHCFVGTVKQKGRRLISVVMGASSTVTRFSETKQLYQAAFRKLNQR
ncbi:hypothetical protein GCM10011391_05960 [Pullulanibacillus camelliae]|uniref:Peptidase S11 D-alanyl-D-alanine carboxypeptidase A N-terminal domain-containing protein n=1 Tax=Pullulanibacillus camelliae TaxID=1707096 RepID=A0A8J2VKW0_9BACL|nr:D-alanyl-D-alanine carboxypeptidase family protein [Pullulanibacillus camelliae]GGE30192.1 hypothetical protein GCM10011391_05960 [Pullulanibacillus camelliae]